MPDPDERLAPAPPEVSPVQEDGLPTGWRALAPDLTPLRRHRDFRLHTLGRGVSFLASMVTFVAVPYQVFELTGSSLAVGLLGVVEMAALLSLAFLGGSLADAVDRRRLVVASDAGLLASIELISYTSGPLLGNAEAGAAASVLGLRGSVVSGGVLCVAGVAVTAACLPAFWAYDDRAAVRS